MRLGKHFADELRQAGVPLDGVAWQEDGQVLFREDVPKAAREAFMAVYEVHNADDPVAAEKLQAKLSLNASDKRMARFAEDLYDVLVSKGLIKETDLPLVAVELINNRKQLRLKGA